MIKLYQPYIADMDFRVAPEIIEAWKRTLYMTWLFIVFVKAISQLVRVDGKISQFEASPEDLLCHIDDNFQYFGKLLQSKYPKEYIHLS
jgi:hypothetical protein